MSPELRHALDAARRASERVMAIYKDFVAIPDARSDITTRADREAQEVILLALREAFPDDAYCAEEATPTLDLCKREAERTWVIDPIDGTKGFAQKTGEFSVMVGLSVGGESVLGVVAEPALGRVTYAERGRGCFIEGESACRVSEQADLSLSVLVSSRWRTPPPNVAALAPGRVVQTNSAGVKLARVARGEADLYVNNYANFRDWDICAGHVLVTEAGGRVTGLGGQAIRYGAPGASQRVGLLATNGRLHDAALARL